MSYIYQAAEDALGAVKADEVVTDNNGAQWKWNRLGTWRKENNQWVKLEAEKPGA